MNDLAWLEELKPLHDKGRIEPATLAALFLMCGWRTLHGRRWLAAPIRPALPTINPNLGPLWQEQGMRTNESPRVFDLIRGFGFWKVSQEVNLALLQWLEKPQSFLLTFNVPTPVEMLRAQAQGRRYVTVLAKPETFYSPIEHKNNAVEFLIHDLEHAYHFHQDQSQHLAQRRFFELLGQSWDQGLFNHLLTDTQFRTDLEYLISDMNSHCVHMFQYLKSKRVELALRSENKSLKESLSPSGHAQMHQWFSQLYESWNLTAEARGAAERSNTPQFQGQADLERLNHFFCESAP